MNENIPFVGVGHSVDVVERVSEVETATPEVQVDPEPLSEVVRPVNAARSAAGRLGAKRVQELVRLGREYEREHGLKAGRQRQRQLIQLGRRYEVEKGLRAAKPRRRKKGDAWAEFLTALIRVAKPAHRPAIERLAAEFRQPKVVAAAA